VETLLAFGAALLAVRLAAALVGRWRRRRVPELALWAASLGAYGLGAVGLAWGAAAGWNEGSFRLYYIAGGMLTAALLGLGSLALAGRRTLAVYVALVYVGLAVGLGVAEPLIRPVEGESIPEAQDHFDLLPTRVLTIVANIVGTLLAVVIAIRSLRRRPIGNTLIIAGVVAAAAGSAAAGLGVAQTSLFVALGVVLLYFGFVIRT
jgi:hypothetical protein